jgi:drug/metabolite transporter (DMT)-like permease
MLVLPRMVAVAKSCLVASTLVMMMTSTSTSGCTAFSTFTSPTSPVRRVTHQHAYYSHGYSTLLQPGRKVQLNAITSPEETEVREEDVAVATTQDPSVDAPASMVYYDYHTDGSIVCARGVCVLADDDDDVDIDDQGEQSFLTKILNTYLGPRLLLAGASVLYGSNFALAALMNDDMPPSAGTAARMVMAAAALSPFLFQLAPEFAAQAALCGCFTGLGYITQSLALVDKSPATVSFIGAAVVLVCPILEFAVDKKPLGLKDAPQTWLAAILCILGVGVLEAYDPASGTFGLGDIGFGDFLSLLQAVGFGTSFFLTERMMRGRPDQALPITAVQVSMSALLCMLWCIGDGWMVDIDSAMSSPFILPNMFFEPTLQTAAWAVAWTGLITTAMNRVIETTALGKVSSADASVILATEPLFAALFSAWLLSEQFGLNDFVGGFLIVAACFATALKPADFERFLPGMTQDQAVPSNNDGDYKP